MAEIRTDFVANLNMKFGLPVNAFDKINQIIFDNSAMLYSEHDINYCVDLYEKNGSVVLFAKVPGTSGEQFFPITTLRHPLWNDISMHTSIVLKDFSINISEVNNVLCANYFVNKFGRKSIADCKLIGEVPCSDGLTRYKDLGFGCAYTGNLDDIGGVLE